MVKTARWSGPVAAVLGALSGVYLMVAPSVFGYVGHDAEVSHRIAGPVLTILWMVCAWSVTRSVRWWTAPIGVWLLAEPLVLAEPRAAAWSALVVGVVTLGWAGLAHDGDVAER